MSGCGEIESLLEANLTALQEINKNLEFIVNSIKGTPRNPGISDMLVIVADQVDKGTLAVLRGLESNNKNSRNLPTVHSDMTQNHRGIIQALELLNRIDLEHQKQLIEFLGNMDQRINSILKAVS